jgi:2-C-methyl-D-erythritol 4-phosphate cytidylyltransferase
LKLKNIVVGGPTRAESVRNGLDVIDPSTAGIVVVHDGARPLVTVDEITRTITAADQHGAACLVAPITDTIKEVIDGKINRTIDRSTLRRALTPQAFQYNILVRAFDGANLHEGITDECYLVELLDHYHPIVAVEGSPRNIKITRPDDLRFAEMFLKDHAAAQNANV